MKFELKTLNRTCRHAELSADDDTARAVIVEKHGRPVVVVLAVEKYESLTGEQISPSQDKSEN